MRQHVRVCMNDIMGFDSPVALESGCLASVQVGDPEPGQVPGCPRPNTIMPHLNLQQPDNVQET